MPRKLTPATEIPTFSTPADAAQWYGDHDTADGDVVSWTAGLTDDALAEIRAVVERSVTTAATRHP